MNVLDDSKELGILDVDAIVTYCHELNDFRQFMPAMNMFFQIVCRNPNISEETIDKLLNCVPQAPEIVDNLISNESIRENFPQIYTRVENWRKEMAARLEFTTGRPRIPR